MLAIEPHEHVEIRVPFWKYVEETANITLDEWQIHLCNRLEKLVNQTGQRLMIHKPPQFGGSVIIAQRLVPYLLGHRPAMRAKIACYNIERATRHTRTAKQLMQFQAHKQYFPESAASVKPTASDKEWSTVARQATYDSQPSYHALGLDSGFTGDGADLLIIDDPYASPNDAKSAAVNNKTCHFLPDTAQPRFNDNTNVVMMFHRYTEDDLAGRTLDDEPDKWEYLRYAAIADGDYVHQNTGVVYPDPLGRKPGEKLSTRRSDSWYQTQQRNLYVWASQFLGRPRIKDGEHFACTKIQFIEGIPKTCKRFVRAWDLAATKDDGDYTAGVLMAYDESDKTVVICDLAHGQWAASERDQHILKTAEIDPRGTVLSLPQDPAQAGKSQKEYFRIMFSRFTLYIHPVSGDKVVRSSPFASSMGLSGVKIVRAKWNRVMIREFESFPVGSNDDIVDAAADAYNYLQRPRGTLQQGNASAGYY